MVRGLLHHLLCLLQGGELELSLLLGDPSAAVGVQGVLGSIILPEAANDAPPRPKLNTAAYQPRNNFKPNIAHTFVSTASRHQTSGVGTAAVT